MASSPYRRFIRPSALRRQQERGNSLDGFQKRRVITGTLMLGLLQNLPVGGRRADAKADPRAVYLEQTTLLETDMRTYLTDTEISNRARSELKKKIKASGQAWVAKYAKGGAVKGFESAKDFYIAVDALLGFFAADEVRVPKRLAKKVLEKLDEARLLIEAGK